MAGACRLAAETFLRRVLAYQGTVRAMIAATIARPGSSFAWVDEALAPTEAALTSADAEAFARLKHDPAVVVSAEALFTLTDPCGLGPDDPTARPARCARPPAARRTLAVTSRP